MHFEVSVVIKVPRTKAFEAFTDFESMPKWSRDKREVKVSREGNVVHLKRAKEEGARTLNLLPPGRVESVGETRFARIGNVVLFDEVSEGTRVTASMDVELKGRWSWLFKTRGRSEAESTAMEELTSFARYVESLG